MVECLIASYDEIIIDDDLCSVCDDQLRLILTYRIEIMKNKPVYLTSENFPIHTVELN